MQVDIDDITLDKEPFIQSTEIKDLLLIRRPEYSDQRGSFQEVSRVPDISKFIEREFVVRQTALTKTSAGVIKGIHAEPQDKLITPLIGSLGVVIVDLRPKSKTYKMWIMFNFKDIESKAKLSIFIPDGCGNSYFVPKGGREIYYHYAVSEVYNPATAGIGIKYDDKTLDIPWPLKNPIISGRDSQLPSFEDFVKKYR